VQDQVVLTGSLVQAEVQDLAEQVEHLGHQEVQDWVEHLGWVEHQDRVDRVGKWIIWVNKVVV
jgi:ACT domain-containing protein